MLTEVLRRLEGVTDRGFVFVRDDLSESVRPFASLIEEARRRGGAFLSLGLRPGDRVALVLPDPEEFVLTFLGAVAAGLVVVPLATPGVIGTAEAYRDAALGILRKAAVAGLVTAESLLPVGRALAAALPFPVTVASSERLPTPDRPLDLAGAPGPEDPCYLQFTSGSTGAPKGAIITHGNVAANVKAIAFDVLQLDRDADVGLSWLPFHHDMGLVGKLLVPLFVGGRMVFLPTSLFLRRPRLWMELASRHRVTSTFGPNFALELTAKWASPDWVRQLDLSCLRILGCGAEPINPATLERFARAFAPAGLRPGIILPSYGMAEATVAISFGKVGGPLRFETVDRRAYEEDRRACPVADASAPGAMPLVSCGKVIPGHELAILSPDGEALPEGRVGEIVFRGPSVTSGYHDDPAATAEALRGGWLHTGDLGCLMDGELFVSGRMKDLIIKSGRNIHAQDVEWLVESVDGIRAGSVVAFGTRGQATERLVVVAEARAGERGGEMIRAIKERIQQRLGLVADDVLLVPPRSLAKTSSGKIQRDRTRREYEAGQFAEAGRAR